MKWIYVDNALVGYIAWTDTSYLGLNVRAIVDFAILERVSRREVIGVLSDVIGSSSSDGLLFMGNARNPTLSRIMRFPFVRIPERLLPQSINLYFRRKSSDRDQAVDDTEVLQSYVTLYDLDFF